MEKITNTAQVRKYISELFHQVKYGFIKEVDLVTFYENVEMITIFFEEEYLRNDIDFRKWKNYISIIKNDVSKYGDGSVSMLDFLHSYLIKQLISIEERMQEIENIDSSNQQINSEKQEAIPDIIDETSTENNFIISTIEDWLFEFKDKMSEKDYQTLVSTLLNYFDTGFFPKISKPIEINGRINKKLFGWALNRILEAKGKSVGIELLQFAKQNISLFLDENFDEDNFRKSNLYKYLTTQTK